MSSSLPAVFALAAAVVLGSPSTTRAQGYGQIGERAAGMAGAFVAVADDASAIYWNPAGVGNIFKFDAQAEGTRSKESFVGAAFPAFGLAYYRAETAVSASDSRQNDGSGKVRSVAAPYSSFGATFVQSIVPKALIGATVRAVSGGGATSFDADFGASASAGDIRVGFAVRNLREALNAERAARVGFAYAPRSAPTGIYGPYTIAVDVDATRSRDVDGDRRDVSVGSEQWWLKGRFGSRLGVRWNALNRADRAVSGGFSAKIGSMWFAEGHLTKQSLSRDYGWGLGGRLAF